MVQDGSAPSSPEQITFDDLCEVIPELNMLSESATPQVVPGANRVPSPDFSFHWGTPLDFARSHKSEPNLRVKLEQEAALHHCTMMETPSMSECLRYSMQVPASENSRHAANPLAGSLLHPDKDFSLTAFRAPEPQTTLPPLPRLVKLEQSNSDQQLIHQAQSMCQTNGLMATDIKRELPPLLEQLDVAKQYPHSFYGPPFSAIGEIDSWLFSNTAFEWEDQSRFSSKIAAMKDTPPAEMYDLLRNDMDHYRNSNDKSDDKDSGLGEELDAYTKGNARKDDLIWSGKSPVSTPDAAKRPKLTPERSASRWESIMRKVPGHRTTFKSGRPRLCQFLLELLEDPDKYSYMIEWLDQERGVFKFVQSGEVARMWGRRRNKPQMKYENFARSLRTYIAKGILTKPRSKLVYRFAKVKN